MNDLRKAGRLKDDWKAWANLELKDFKKDYPEIYQHFLVRTKQSMDAPSNWNAHAENDTSARVIMVGAIAPCGEPDSYF